MGAEPHDLGGERRPVGLDEPRLDGGERADRVVEQAGAVGAADPGVHGAVAGDDLHPVAGVPGERGEEERGIHRGVQARGVADPSGARARGVEDDDDAAVLLGLPGAHDEVAAPRGGPPVDGPHVVAVDVVAQAVELGALAAGAHRGPAVELAQDREPARQVLAGREGVEGADRPGHLDRALPGGEAEGPADAHGHAVGDPVTPPGGHEVGREAHPLVRRHGEGRARRRRAPADGRPRVAQQAAHAAVGGVRDPQGARRRLAQAHLGRLAARDGAAPPGGSRAARRAPRGAPRRGATTAPSTTTATARRAPAPAGPAPRCAG